MNDSLNSNPYAPPRQLITSPFEGLEFNDRVWRKGNLIVLPVGRELPPLCVRTGAKGEMPVKLTFAWNSPFALLALGTAFLLLIVLTAMLFSILLFCVGVLLLIGLRVYCQKKREVNPWLTANQFHRRRTSLVIGYLAIVGGIGLIFYGNAYAAQGFGTEGNQLHYLIAFLAILFVLLGGFILVRRNSPLLVVEQLTDQFTLLSGAKEPFLQNLEEFPYPLP